MGSSFSAPAQKCYDRSADSWYVMVGVVCIQPELLVWVR